MTITHQQWNRASKYIVLTGDIEVDTMSVIALEQTRVLVSRGKSNDKLKYTMPECFKTSLVWTVNMRSLQNFLSLRTDKAALAEIRELAYEIFAALPVEHGYLFADYVKVNEVI